MRFGISRNLRVSVMLNSHFASNEALAIICISISISISLYIYIYIYIYISLYIYIHINIDIYRLLFNEVSSATVTF